MVSIYEYWQHICDIKNAAGNGKFRHILNISLSIHHGNADAERSFFGNKNVLTKDELSLSEETLIVLPRYKQYSRNAGSAHQALVSRLIMNKVKDAHLNHTYLQHAKERRRKAEETQ